jgi:hypothetical protein
MSWRPSGDCGGDDEHRVAAGIHFGAAGAGADEIAVLAAALEAHERAEADGLAGAEVAGGQRLKLGDGLRRLLGGLGLAVGEVGGLEAAGVVFVLGLVLVVGRLGVRGEGGVGDLLQLGGELGDDAGEEVALGHGVSVWPRRHRSRRPMAGWKGGRRDTCPVS